MPAYIEMGYLVFIEKKTTEFIEKYADEVAKLSDFSKTNL